MLTSARVIVSGLCSAWKAAAAASKVDAAAMSNSRARRKRRRSWSVRCWGGEGDWDLRADSAACGVSNLRGDISKRCVHQLSERRPGFQ